MLELRKWQQEAFDAWRANNDNGIIQAATGSGKSILFMQAIKVLSRTTLVVVPTQQLMYQHAENIKRMLNIPVWNIGFLGDGHHDTNTFITIGVINTVRETNLESYNLLVLDECHHYFSDVNNLILQKWSPFKACMMLTATMDFERMKDTMQKNIYPVVYNYAQGDCIKDGVINNYEVINARIHLNDLEFEEYSKASDFVKEHFKKYKTVPNIIVRLRGDQIAQHLLRSINKRKTVLSNCESRISKTVEIILRDPEQKTVVFGETIKAAKQLYKIIKDNCRCGIYHSNMKLEERKIMLQDFFDDKIDCMISVKALNEGLDVPSCERAIIMSGNSVPKDFMQRVGRVLRKSDKGTSTVYQLFVPDSKDEDWLEERMSLVDESLIKIRYE